MKCRYCGNDLSDRAIVCPHCGEPVLEEDKQHGRVATEIEGKKIYFWSNDHIKRNNSDFDKVYMILAILFGIIAYFVAVVKDNEEGKKGAAWGIIINYCIIVLISLIWALNKYVF